MERPVAGVDPGGRLAAQVELETVGGFGVAQPFEGLEEHHRRHHPGRNGRSPPHRLLVEIGEVVVPEELVTVIGQEPVDRTLPYQLGAAHAPSRMQGLRKARGRCRST